MKKWILFVAMILVLGCVLPACSGKTQPEDDPVKDELAQDFLRELRDVILPYREQPVKLAEMGVVITTAQGTANLRYVEGFYDYYKTGQSTNLTIAFYSDSPLVVVRVAMTGETGYYFRYEFEEDAEIAITSKPVDRLALEVSESGRTSLSLYDGREELATFSMKPLPNSSGDT